MSSARKLLSTFFHRQIADTYRMCYFSMCSTVLATILHYTVIWMLIAQLFQCLIKEVQKGTENTGVSWAPMENLSNRMLLNLCSWKDNVVFPMQNSKGRGWYLRTCKSKIKMYLLVLLGLWVDKKWVVQPLSMNCLSKSLFSLFHSLFFTNSPSEKWVYFH